MALPGNARNANRSTRQSAGQVAASHAVRRLPLIMDIPRTPVPERVLRRNPSRRVADRRVRLVILFATLCGVAAISLTAALHPGGDDGELALLAGALAFVAGVGIAQRHRR